MDLDRLQVDAMCSSLHPSPELSYHRHHVKHVVGWIQVDVPHHRLITTSKEEDQNEETGKIKFFIKIAIDQK
jgi:hypothetical protein